MMSVESLNALEDRRRSCATLVGRSDAKSAGLWWEGAKSPLACSTPD